MIRPALAGAAATLAGRAALRTVLLRRFRGHVAALNRGDHAGLLAEYADDAVLRFNPGAHRWAGDHVGKPAIERFLRDFTGAGMQGELVDMWFGGPLHRMTMVARFDDASYAPDGRQLYANRTALVLRTRWGKIVEHEDFYEDTGRIQALEDALTGLGVHPVAAGYDAA